MQYLTQDFDELATEDKAREAIADIISEENQGTAKVSVLEPNRREQRIALIEEENDSSTFIALDVWNMDISENTVMVQT